MSSNLFAESTPDATFDFFGMFNRDRMDELLAYGASLKVADVKIKSGDYVRAKIAGRWQRLTKRQVTHPEVDDCARGIYGENAGAELLSGSGLDISHEVKTEESIWRKRFRVNMTSCRTATGIGYELTIRTLSSQPIPWHLLGIEKDIEDNLRPELGLNMITGPTGSGKSTLLASAIRFLCEDPDRSESVLEYSSPIEYVYDGLNFPNSFVTQCEIGRHIAPRHIQNPDERWTYAISNSLRRAPDIILINECKDRPTMSGILEASQTGHLAMSTLHTNSVAETVARILFFYPPEERRAIAVQLMDSLNLVVTQRLIDRKPRLVDGKVVKSKIGVREYMVFDSKVKATLMATDPEEWSGQIRDMLSKRTVIGRSMADAAKALLEDDLITPETYEYVAARTSGTSKVEREAYGASRGGPSILSQIEG